VHEFNLTHFEVELDSANAEVTERKILLASSAFSYNDKSQRNTGFTGIFALIQCCCTVPFEKEQGLMSWN